MKIFNWLFNIKPKQTDDNIISTTYEIIKINQDLESHNCEKTLITRKPIDQSSQVPRQYFQKPKAVPENTSLFHFATLGIFD